MKQGGRDRGGNGWYKLGLKYQSVRERERKRKKKEVRRQREGPGKEKNETTVEDTRCVLFLRGCLISSSKTRRHILRTQSDPFISAPETRMHNALSRTLLQRKEPLYLCN